MNPTEVRIRFFELHARPEVFVIPNPWDVGSAKLLAGAGFEALATTSAGFAWAQGRDDYGVARDELVEHVRSVAAAVDLPLNVDSERCFAEDLDGVAETVRLLHDAGAAGCSIEDWNGPSGRIDPIELATERVAAAVEAAHPADDHLVLTARAENHIRGVDDLDDTIARLVAYRAAGADCVYAPGLNTVEQIRAVVDAVDAPVNVLARLGGPTVTQIGEAGGRRVSVGGALASHAYASMLSAANELLDSGTSTYVTTSLTAEQRSVFG